MENHFMKLALNIAKSLVGQTSPNPPVGSVVVKDGEIIGIGGHFKAGEQHAEINAIKLAEMNGRNVQGSTIYITLEPCDHLGKTGSCADFLISKGVKKVVIGSLDPNLIVNGKGIEKLRRNGIEVIVGVLKNECNMLIQEFREYITNKKPYVTLKIAMSLDGKIATHTGDSKWITSVEARKDAHKYRHRHDSILVGVNTIITDNPSLTTHQLKGSKNPIRIILDTNFTIPLESKVIINGESPTWIITCVNKKVDLPSHVKVITVKSTKDSGEVLYKLGEMGITSILVEGGAKIFTNFYSDNNFDQLVFYMAPKIVGGKSSINLLHYGKEINFINESSQVFFEDVKKIGPDIKLVGKKIKGV
ncbi:bifunctional diaminohydroxyphosphoribosylaminopyrimidine deaminase/5-amino-6-(5-phosphoribosylamino)uracil reductase RibD [Bacillus cereus]|uniref:bifunctional diaminohydroxyphosphoribosylaminopyrimidine deaminase/5-amino-6-(5-phosphoribosylamino)uracil reductase RibD n=1 Tax=Bacillus cereus group TaxID=86661 RepID=UPI001D0BE9DF|nr:MULTISPECIES: bifunctional diaminohydroxyphosphoribosylaminopyrimidine deaminase/5-amino-6-(5-phosphoribosylamino)uracil reductase RibD [Bacillus cereus group]MCU5064598.1 bifunctional diaminohydroxyphosphoribosylaminopyrimidine deaminase/5-amino-6-(5-phosphoribosylamino)uracil reductase RibD [Bacillus cereus]MCU5243215.1 bifunctional diaminohydroxyphosphoribosylaminopyrimidine deaminase/5-amino-6-(5-phosphoribosylamino)uracil reductase RibD [Bacillus cereus]